MRSETDVHFAKQTPGWLLSSHLLETSGSRLRIASFPQESAVLVQQQKQHLYGFRGSWTLNFPI